MRCRVESREIAIFVVRVDACEKCGEAARRCLAPRRNWWGAVDRWKRAALDREHARVPGGSVRRERRIQPAIVEPAEDAGNTAPGGHEGAGRMHERAP